MIVDVSAEIKFEFTDVKQFIIFWIKNFFKTIILL